MAKEIKLSASKRETSGTSAAKALRKTGWMPAVVYGEKGARSLKVDRREFDTMLKHHTSENLILDLDVEGEGVTKALLREVQHESVYGGVLHADFVEISMTKKMRVSIAVALKGEPVGVSQGGGILEHLLRHLDVECLPTDLVEAIDVDVSGLNLGDTLMVRDLKIDAKFAILTAGDVAVATVVAPREEKVEEAAAVEGAPAAGTEPEVIGKKKEEGEEGKEGKDGKKAEPAKDEKKEKKESKKA